MKAERVKSESGVCWKIKPRCHIFYSGSHVKEMRFRSELFRRGGLLAAKAFRNNVSLVTRRFPAVGWHIYVCIWAGCKGFSFLCRFWEVSVPFREKSTGLVPGESDWFLLEVWGSSFGENRDGLLFKCEYFKYIFILF